MVWKICSKLFSRQWYEYRKYEEHCRSVRAAVVLFGAPCEESIDALINNKFYPELKIKTVQTSYCGNITFTPTE